MIAQEVVVEKILAHVGPVQIVKRREGGRVTQVDVRYTHGSRRRVPQALEGLGDLTPTTSAIERRKGTARRMSAHQARKSLAFSRRPDTKLALGWWGVMVYNSVSSSPNLPSALKGTGE